MNKPTTFLAALAAVFLLSSPVQASDAELKVTGAITPPACNPSFLYGGVVNYGTISSETLQTGSYTQLEHKKVALTVTCKAGTRVALVFADNRAATRVEGIMGAIERFNFGLGSLAGKNIGGYDIRFDSMSFVDGAAAINLHSTDAGATWSDNTGYADTVGTYISFATDGATPATGKVFSVVMNVHAVINKPENLPLTQTVPLDGSATIEVKYL